MAFNPYGPAYFIGSGLANLPQNMQNNEARRVGLSMQKLGLQRAQDEMEDLQAQNKAYSEPLQVPTETVNTPEYDDYLKRQRIQQAMPEGTMIPSLTGTPSQMGDIVPPEPEQKQVQRPIDLTNKPWLREAIMHQQAAGRLRQMSRGRAAQAAEEMANKYHQQHLTEGFGRVYQALMLGDMRGAVDALNTMGMRNIKAIEPAEPDQYGQKQYRVIRTDENGQDVETMLTAEQVRAMGNPAMTGKMGQILAQSQWQNRRIAEQERHNRVREYQISEDQKRRGRVSDAQIERWKSLTDRAATGGNSVYRQKVEDLARAYENSGMTPQAARDKAVKDVNGFKKNTATDVQRLNALNGLAKNHPGRFDPEGKTEQGRAYLNLQKQIADIAGRIGAAEESLGPTGGSAPQPATQKPSFRVVVRGGKVVESNDPAMPVGAGPFQDGIYTT